MAKYEEIFSKGYIEKHNITEFQASKVWDSISTFADYGFNKSHSIAYALLTYYGAYLKAYYPVQYMTALMRSRVSKPKFLKRYITEAKRMGIVMSPPNINTSKATFTPGNNEISIGFNSLVGIGDTVASNILEIQSEKAFSDIYDFMTRTGSNKKVLEVLAKAGAFDCLDITEKILLQKQKTWLSSCRTQRTTMKEKS
jgi:DNA polymerase-3 subunit alpha